MQFTRVQYGGVVLVALVARWQPCEAQLLAWTYEIARTHCIQGDHAHALL
eukprot:COSAG02_NODE_2545_length_8565_cov_7.011339_1_plen_50_part_00